MNASLVIATTLAAHAGQHTATELKPGPIARRLAAQGLPPSLAAAGVEGGRNSALRFDVQAVAA